MNPVKELVFEYTGRYNDLRGKVKPIPVDAHVVVFEDYVEVMYVGQTANEDGERPVVGVVQIEANRIRVKYPICEKKMPVAIRFDNPSLF